MTIRIVLFVCLATLGRAVAAGAQPTPPPTPEPVAPPPAFLTPVPGLLAASIKLSAARDATDDLHQKPPSGLPEGRVCEGCPKRSVGKSLFQATMINVFYGAANLIRGQVTARITPKTWWDNMEHGWVWDLDDFVVNQMGHPYQGNNYFNAGRANGLSFYESAALTAFGSGTWEYYGETNLPSLNDFINTTLGGIALGEMFHRAGWLVRNTRATGRGRLWSEIAATALDPVTGANRFITGDASRVSEKPAEFVPSSLGGIMAAGVLWRGSQTRAVDAAGQPFVEMDLLYGDPRTGSSLTPYDAFAVRLRFGGGAGFSEAKVRGRLAAVQIKNSQVRFAVFQSYDFQTNDAYSTGAQSFEAAVAWTQKLSTRTSMWLMGWGGLTVLGAVDSLPLGVTERPEEEEPGPDSGGQGVSEGPRFYDYGPGGNFGFTAEFAHDGHMFALLSYEGRHLYSLDGVRANHFLSRTRLDLLLPLRGRLGFGTSAEYLLRRTYYQDEHLSKQRYTYPQIRAYFTWRLS